MRLETPGAGATAEAFINRIHNLGCDIICVPEIQILLRPSLQDTRKYLYMSTQGMAGVCVRAGKAQRNMVNYSAECRAGREKSA